MHKSYILLAPATYTSVLSHLGSLKFSLCFLTALSIGTGKWGTEQLEHMLKPIYCTKKAPEHLVRIKCWAMGSEIHARMLDSGEREEFHCTGSQDGSRKSSCAAQELGCVGRKNSSMSISGSREVLNRSLTTMDCGAGTERRQQQQRYKRKACVRSIWKTIFCPASIDE